MKKLIFISTVLTLFAFLFCTTSQAQNTYPWPATGSIGIGIATPAVGTMLDVRNDAASSVFQVGGFYNGTSGIRDIGSVQFKNTSNGDYYFVGMRRNGTSTEVVQSVYDAGAGLFRAFCFFSAGTRKYEIRAGVMDIEYKNAGNIVFSNPGYLGIGTTVAPPVGVKLAVNGKVNCKEVEVTLSGWSDFVFKNDYKLMSLYDVENFISKNKHLPDVPSESDVVSNGLKLGEMNAVLLQKIEELTLYVINIQKENDALKARVSKLEK